jgi:hypothetical protein
VQQKMLVNDFGAAKNLISSVTMTASALCALQSHQESIASLQSHI